MTWVIRGEASLWNDDPVPNQKGSSVKAHFPEWMESLAAPGGAGPYFSAEDLYSLGPIDSGRKLSRRQILFQEGETPLGIYGVLRGSFRLFKAGPEGQEQILDLALPGALLGLRALASGDAYSASACAREDSQVCFFDGRHFMAMVDEKPGLARAVLGSVGRQLREARQELLERSVSSVATRLAHWILHVDSLYRAHGTQVRITGQELANMVGAAQETISRRLTQFQVEGLIERKGRSLKILKRTTMCEMAGIQQAVPPSP
jgi:CRP-like cAMP-binding protein